MYKNKIILLIFLASILFLNGCKDDEWFDNVPKGYGFPDNVKVLEQMLESRVMHTPEVYSYWRSDNLELPEGKVPNITYRVRAYDFEPSATAITEDDPDWTSQYIIINRANIILDNVDAAEQNALTSKAEIKATALVYRAKAYFELINLFCFPYVDENQASESNSGVPLLLTDDINADLTRASLKEVYDQIISDLIASIDGLPTTAEMKTRPTKAAAHALLARIYLTRGEYGKALDESKSALSYNSSLIDYNVESDSLNPWVNPEVILAEYTTHTAMNNYGVNGLSYLSQGLYNLYDPDNDLRFLNYINTDIIEGIAYYEIKYESYYNPGVKIPEMILIAAECEARTGDWEISAMSYVNTIRAKRFVSGSSATELIASSREDAINKVLDERRRELAFKGHRYYDIRRLNAIENANISLVRKSTKGEIFTIVPNDKLWTLNIPPKLILTAPEIVQNP